MGIARYILTFVGIESRSKAEAAIDLANSRSEQISDIIYELGSSDAVVGVKLLKRAVVEGGDLNPDAKGKSINEKAWARNTHAHEKLLGVKPTKVGRNKFRAEASFLVSVEETQSKGFFGSLFESGGRVMVVEEGKKPSTIARRALAGAESELVAMGRRFERAQIRERQAASRVTREEGRLLREALREVVEAFMPTPSGPGDSPPKKVAKKKAA